MTEVADAAAAEAAIQQWKIERLIKSLDNARGNGTSMITLSTLNSFKSYS